MADTPKVYVLCDANCKWEGMTKEQILTAITQAVTTGEIGDINTGFVQTIKTINGLALKFFVGEQSEYDALSEEDKKDLFAIITNDTTKDGLYNAFAEVEELVGSLLNRVQDAETEINDIKGGYVPVDKADKANKLNIRGTIGNSDKGDFKLVVGQRGVSGYKDLYESPVTYNPETKELSAPNFVGAFKGNADSATNVPATVGFYDSYRHIWFSDRTYDTQRAYEDNFLYNPATGTLKVTKVDGTAERAIRDNYGNMIVATYAMLTDIPNVSSYYANTNFAGFVTLGAMPSGKTLNDIVAFAYQGDYAQLHGVKAINTSNNQLNMECSGMVRRDAGMLFESANALLTVENGYLKVEISDRCYQQILNNSTIHDMASYKTTMKYYFVYFK